MECTSTTLPQHSPVQECSLQQIVSSFACDIGHYFSMDCTNLVYQGINYHWGTSNTIDVTIVDHVGHNITEVIPYEPTFGTESPRIYLRTAVLCFKLDHDDIERQLGCAKRTGVPATQKFIDDLVRRAKCDYILQHLAIAEFSLEQNTVLVKFQSSVVGAEDGDLQNEQPTFFGDLICDKPELLVPYKAIHSQTSIADSTNDEHAELQSPVGVPQPLASDHPRERQGIGVPVEPAVTATASATASTSLISVSVPSNDKAAASTFWKASDVTKEMSMSSDLSSMQPPVTRVHSLVDELTIDPAGFGAPSSQPSPKPSPKQAHASHKKKRSLFASFLGTAPPNSRAGSLSDLQQDSAVGASEKQRTPVSSIQSFFAGFALWQSGNNSRVYVDSSAAAE